MREKQKTKNKVNLTEDEITKSFPIHDSFAGISFVHEEFNKCGLLQLIDEQLGKRNASGYGHGELFRTWFEIFFCGGEVAEDVQEHLRSTLESMMKQISRISEWEKVEINCKTYKSASILFKWFFEERNYRLVVMWEESDEKQIFPYGRKP